MSIQNDDRYPILTQLISDVNDVLHQETHTHDNKIVLDSITQENVDNWNNGTGNPGGGITTVTLDNLDSTLYAFMQSISGDGSTPSPTDNPPSISTISNLNSTVNISFNISYTATDDYGISKHEFSEDNGTTWITISPNNSGNLYTYAKTYSAIETKTCKIRVTDTNSQITTSNSFTITVTDVPVDNSPVISTIGNISVDVNSPCTISYVATDDGSITTHEFSEDDGATWSVISPSASGNNYTYTKTYTSSATKNCNIRVTDNASKTTVSNTFIITISEVGSVNTITVTDLKADTLSVITKVDNNTFYLTTAKNNYSDIAYLKLNGSNITDLNVEIDKGTEMYYSIWILVSRLNSDSLVIQMDEGGFLKYYKFGTLTGNVSIGTFASKKINIKINSSDGIVTISDVTGVATTKTFNINTIYPALSGNYGIGVSTNALSGKAILTIPTVSTFSLMSEETSTYSVATLTNSLTPCTYNIPNKIDLLESRLNNINVSGLPTRLYTLNEAYLSWINGDKFPIAIYGDSTTDGDGTTNEVVNVAGQDTISPNAYPEKLQELLITETENPTLRVYNAGYRTKNIDYGISTYNTIFTTGAFSDTKLVGIRFGINDSGDNGSNLKTARKSFKTKLITLVNKIISDSKQPFLITTQPFVKPKADWVFKDSYGIDIMCNEVYREVASEYNLEILDIFEKLEEFLIYSKYPADTITDKSYHFKDIGHLYTAGLLFKHISKRVINVGHEKVRVDYLSQKLGTDLQQDGNFKTPITTSMLNWTVDTTFGFKVKAKTTKADTNDIKIFDAYVFIDTKTQKNIKAYVDVFGTQYVKINGVVKNLTGVETDLGELELGLHHLEVYTGESTSIDFKGFIIN